MLPTALLIHSMIEQSFVDRWNQIQTEGVLEREVDLVPIPGRGMVPIFVWYIWRGTAALGLNPYDLTMLLSLLVTTQAADPRS